MKTDAKTLQLVDIPKVLELIEKECRSPLGVLCLREQEPLPSIQHVEERQALFVSFCKYEDVCGRLPWEKDLNPLGRLFEDAKVSGLLSGVELVHIRNMVGLAIRIKDVVSDRKDAFAELYSLTRRIPDLSELFDDLHVLADDGRLYDRASELLERLRSAHRDYAAKARKAAQNLVSNPSVSSMLQDKNVHYRKGRIVLLVRQENLHKFRGIVIDRSSSGNSLYMEPEGLIEINNRVSILEKEIEEEERRILRSLTRKVLMKQKLLERTEQVLGLLDLMYALREVARKDRWSLPLMKNSPMLKLKGARHPLLGKQCVPIDIFCGTSFKQLIITGPNTGGKTVALKTVAVSLYLGWCGFPVPCKEGTEIGDIDWMLADIGDEQSIEQNLSTFSAHLTRLIDMLQKANERSLFLLDELGAGTDPQEGAALGIAILERFRSIGSLVIATTHHNSIKRYALSTKGVETASMEFDSETLKPTFRLLMGMPGKSNALTIARHLGMPEEILSKAEEVLLESYYGEERLVDELHDKHMELDQLKKQLESKEADLQRLKDELEREKRNLALEKGRIVSEAERKALEMIEEAQSLYQEMVKKIGFFNTRKMHKSTEKDRQRMLKMKKELLKRQDTFDERTEREEISPGDLVEIIGQSTKGTVETIEEGKAVLLCGPIKVEVQLNKLKLVKKKEKVEEAAVQGPIIKGDFKKVSVPPSIMIRGMTVDEAIPEVELYLDRAFRAGYGEVTIIHGRGEGILRREVHALCKRLPYVTNFRLGEPSEGGIGVTIVSFR